MTSDLRAPLLGIYGGEVLVLVPREASTRTPMPMSFGIGKAWMLLKLYWLGTRGMSK